MIPLSENEKLIEFVDVSKEYSSGNSKVIAISNIDLSVLKGEFAVIMGPSGSGKSTLLNLIAGFTEVTSGEIFIKGRPLTKLNRKEKVEIRRFTIGFVFQFFNLHPFLTSIENIELPMLFAKTPKKERRSRAMDLIDLVNLKEKANNYPHELSSGQQQRIGIARALANKPDIILADEPTGNLDSMLSKEIVDYLIRLNHDEGVSVILVSHDEFVLEKNMRIVKLTDGKIVSS